MLGRAARAYELRSDYMKHVEGIAYQASVTPSLNKQIVSTVIMWLMVICLAIAVVYCKHTNRSLHAKLQDVTNASAGLQNERSKLLLERAAWLAHGRVEQIAKQRLNMVMPNKVEIIKP